MCSLSKVERASDFSLQRVRRMLARAYEVSRWKLTSGFWAGPRDRGQRVVEVYSGRATPLQTILLLLISITSVPLMQKRGHTKMRQHAPENGE